MLSDIVKVGQNVEIQTIKGDAASKDGESGEEKKVYRTKIFDVISEDRIEVLMPTEKTKLVLLSADGEYNVCFMTDRGTYQCFAKVADRYKSNNMHILVLEITSNLRKQQRREYYRFSCVLEMGTRELDMEEIRSVEGRQTFLLPGLPLKHSVIVDISGGGLRFIASTRYPVGGMVYCNFNLALNGKIKEYHTVGKVLAATELDKKPGLFEHRIQYVNLKSSTREEIIKYIFQEERRKRRKELEE